ncbi:hypothetical protein [uncultured Celeribacter sp.]|uniref:hypothetical protein n=1 Tax=uncultured Celeribacter sp. TaxID=1303376 RepID=UPI002AA7BD59|nr:hypothetical protein [uncultured Celeribacter sp.]
MTNNRGKLPKPSLEAVARMPHPLRAQVDRMLSCAAVGGPETLGGQISTLIEQYQPDELMVTGMIHDQAVRIRSFEIAAEVMRGLSLVMRHKI